MTDGTVVLVPGPGGAEEDLGFLAPMLGRHHEVVIVGPARADSLQELADAVGDAVRDSATPPAVIGYSLGGVASVAYAAEHPDGLSALVVVAAWLHPSEKLIAHAGLWSALADRPEVLAEFVRLTRHSAAGWESARHPRVDRETQLRVELAARSGVAQLAPAVRVPTLVIGCRDDELAGVGQSRLLFGAIPDARYAEVASGHAVLNERPAEVLQLIESFLARPERHPAGTLIGAAEL